MDADGSETGRREHGSIRGIIAETCRFFKATPYAVSVIWRFQPVLLIVLAISTILDGISPTASVWITRYFLDAIVNVYQQHGQAEYVKKAVYMLVLLIVVIGG